jgi:translation initiation factor 1
VPGFARSLASLFPGIRCPVGYRLHVVMKGVYRGTRFYANWLFQPLAGRAFAVKLRDLFVLAWGLPMAKKASSLASLGGLVYSTDSGRHCPDCGKPAGNCTCGTPVLPEGDGIARVRRESKGRGGKTVTTVTGVPLPLEDLKVLATSLKRRCATGGALKDGVIEIQGDHVELLLAELIRQGFKARKSGG